MKHIDTAKHRGFFKPVLQSPSLQAAMMVLRPGQASSEEKENEHPRAEQWVFVIGGHGMASAGKRSQKIKAGSLVLIEKDEAHQTKNIGKKPLTTINFYAPPAYDSNGEVRMTVKRPSVASVLKRLV